jgi:hypothetical protein
MATFDITRLKNGWQAVYAGLTLDAENPRFDRCQLPTIFSLEPLGVS